MRPGDHLEEERRHGYLFPIPGGALDEQPALVRDALYGLNKLAGVKFNNASQLFHRPLTAVQKVAVANAHQAVVEAGEAPDLSGRDALQDMMKAHPTYGEPSALAPFDAAKLKILRSTGRPKAIEQLLPPHVLPLMLRWKTHIEMTAAEFKQKLDRSPDCCPKRPYWDPILKSEPDKRSQLIADLWRVGIIKFRTSIKAAVGLFFVKKKTPEWIRMVVDCRIGNAHHRQPPVTRLGSASSFVDLDMSPDVLRHKLGCSGSPVGWGAELDVSDCFYQFEMKQLSKWFGIDDPRSVSAWEKWGIQVTSVFDEDMQTDIPVFSDTILYPVIGAMPMGWTWAFFFANETVAALARASSTPERPLECREKMPTPQLWDCDTFTSTYVDNVSVFGADRAAVVERMKALTQTFESHSIPVVWSQAEPVQKVETVGVIVDFEDKVVRNKPSRLWKVYLAGRELCRRDKVRGEAVEVWTGHATSLFRLCPCLLSVFSVIYRFNMVCRGRRVKLWPAVRAEIMQATSLIWFARAKLDGDYVQQVDMGDSSTSGYAMMTRSFSSLKIHEVTKVREKWRFIPLPEDFRSAVEFFNSGGTDVSDDADEHIKAFVRAGVGLDTEYGKWVQQALQEGSWLKTSPIVSQLKAQPKRRDDVEVPALVKPLPSDMVAVGSFKLLWMRKWRNSLEHINLKEGRVLLSSLKRAARVSSQCGCKKLTVSDNLPAVLAFEKGRSGSVALNRLCKTAASIQTALQIRWRIRHIETKRHLADSPSRGWWNRQCPSPCLDNVNGDPCPSSASSQVQKPKRVQLYLSDLLPPPGLDWNPVSKACGPDRAVRRDVSGCSNDHGHATCAGRRGKKKVQQVKIFWELFSGEGNLSSAFRKFSWRVIDPVDIRWGAKQDLTNPVIQQAVREIILGKKIDYLHMGTPCTVFSRARRGGDWTLQESEKLGHAVRIDQERGCGSSCDSETFASVLQILRFHRIFGPAALPVGQPCRKSKLPLLRQDCLWMRKTMMALSYFQLEQVKGSGKGSKGRAATASAASWLSPLEVQVPRREEVYEASSDTNSPVRWEVAVEVFSSHVTVGSC
eukprot:s13_g50.t1